MSDTSTIDEKKSNNNSSTAQNMAANVGKFILLLLIIIGFVIFYFCLGGSVLYGCKLAQSNILPTNEKCFPYTDTKPEIASILTNIFISFTDPPLSAKLNFPYDKYNSKNLILDMFREYKNEPKSNFLANYFISIIESIISYNYWAFNLVLNMMNGLPEPIIVLFGPILVSICSTFIFLSDHFYLMYLWFSKMGWFFKENENMKEDHPPIWKDVTVTNIISYSIAIGLIFLFCFLFLILLIFALPVIPFLTMSWCLFSGLGFKGEIGDKSVNLLYILRDLLKFYKVTIMSILSFFVVVSAFANLGSLYGLLSIFALGLIGWGIVSVDLFKPLKPEDLSELVNGVQAHKKCTVKMDDGKGKHGFLYNLIFPQKGGKHMVNELKKIGKKLNNK